MTRRKILWLCSWYPGPTEPFHGDFVQRHARAASLFNDIYVIHVWPDPGGQIRQKETYVNNQAGLREEIILFPAKNGFLGRLFTHKMLLGYYRQAIRQYLHSNGKPDLVHVHVPMKAGIAALWMKRSQGIPMVVTEHWGIYNDIVTDNYQTRNNAFKFYTKAVFSKAEQCISVSRYLALGVNKMVVKKDFSIIPNVVDTSLFFYKPRQPGRFRFIHVSNMVPLKNAEGILRAFSLLLKKEPGAELVMVGDTGPVIGKYAVQMGLNDTQVRFRGEISYASVAAEMQESDCLVLFSNIENSPCVIGEALCCGLPVVATNVGGIPELVDSSNSILVEPGNYQALASAMQQMIELARNIDPVSIAGKASGKFGYKVVSEKLDQVYASVLNKA